MSTMNPNRKFQINIQGLEITSIVRMISTSKFIHVVWNQNTSNKGVYLMTSSDDGNNFTASEKIMEISGEIKDLQIIAKEQNNEGYVVVTVIEKVQGKISLRAVTGMVSNDLTYTFKPCEKCEIFGEMIHYYTVFTTNASEDHIFIKTPAPDSTNTNGVGNTLWEVTEIVCIHCDLSVLREIRDKLI